MEMPVVSQRDGESDCDLPHAKTARNARIKVVFRMMIFTSSRCKNIKISIET